jgi:hypothetical protein
MVKLPLPIVAHDENVSPIMLDVFRLKVQAFLREYFIYVAQARKDSASLCIRENRIFLFLAKVELVGGDPDSKPVSKASCPADDVYVSDMK